MSYTADFLIEKRKQRWADTQDIEKDIEWREAIAEELISDADLRAEVRRYPEKLIELVFVVVDKQQKTMPFFLNQVQQSFVARLNQAKEDFSNGVISDISILVLKGRQQGFTTLVTAYQLACCITNKNFQGYTLADTSDNSESIFQAKAKYPYGMLPDKLRPTEKFNNRKQLLFEKLNSSWAVNTATKEVGRSKTINFFHGSECAFWTVGIAPIQAALGEAFTLNCIKIYESTANGYNDYQRMWDSGAHINCFFEWWQTPEYRIVPPDADAFKRDIESNTGWIWDRLRWLRDEKKLSVEQMYWYYTKYEKFLVKDLIKQEYPCTPHEAFLLSGANVFDVEAIQTRLEHLPRVLKQGFFEYEYDGITISDIRWVNDHNGFIKLYALPTLTQYCIGGDTAGGDSGEDFFTGHVLDARTGEQIAVLKHQFDSDLYAKQMYCLGRYYKDALIGIEANFDSYPIMELQRLGYTNQYVREAIDTYTGRTEKKFGFKTTSLTRPTIISRLIEIVREHCDTINDKATLEELLTIIRNEKGRIEAPVGGHDDMMVGLAIAHQIREQVDFTEEVVEMPERHFFNDDDEWDASQDWGQPISIV